MNWSGIKHFAPSEFTCQCGACGSIGDEMDQRFMERLDGLRARLGVPFVITSGYRCPAHNQRVSGTGAAGPHTTGHAADVALSGEVVYELLQFAPAFAMTGIGLNQKGPHERRYVHLDDLETGPRPRVWTY